MKKSLRGAVAALMGLGLLFSTVACDRNKGTDVPDNPKVGSISVGDLSASGATTNVKSDDDLKAVFAALDKDPVINTDSLKNPVSANLVKSVARSADSDSEDDDWDYGDDDSDWDYGDDDDSGLGGSEGGFGFSMPDLGPLNEFVEEVMKFYEAAPDEDGNLGATLSYDKTFDLKETGIEGVNGTVDKGNLKLVADLTATRKAGETESKMTYSGSVTGDASITITPEKESIIKKLISNINTSIEASDASVTTDAEGMSLSGKVKIGGSADAGFSVCTEDGLGGKIVLTSEGGFTVNLAKVMDLIADFMGDMEDDSSEGPDFNLIMEKLQEVIECTMNVTVKAFADDGKETYSKTFKNLEELEAFFPTEEE